MRKFEGKKLIILGGNPETVPLVQYANEMGIETIVTSARPTDAAKRYAHKSFDIDGMDVAGVVELARRENADGVLVGVADVLIESYQKICAELGKPCYANEITAKVFTNKNLFKRTCERYGVNGIPEYHLTPEMKKEDTERNVYPVLIKPVDNGGGVGMRICSNKDELQDGVAHALNNSRSKTFIAERYMNCDDMFVYYTFQNGRCELSAIADRYTTKSQGRFSPVCMGAVYPSKHRDLYFDKMHGKMLRLFKDVKMDNGVLLIQCFVENDQIYVYDPGFRLQGEAPHLLIKSINGFDHREMLITFALTGNMGDVDLQAVNDSNFKGKTAGSLWILLRAGTIGSIEGMDILRNDKNVVNIVQRFEVGDEVTEQMVGNEKQVFARIYIVCDSREEYKKELKKIEDSVKISDKNGDSMILPMLKPEVLE